MDSRFVLVWLVTFSIAGAIEQNADAQTVFGRNLMVNGDAETGQASDSGNTPVPSIPGWTRTGNADVILWNEYGDLNTTADPGPLNPGNKYFTGGPDNASSSLSQDIDVSDGATQIDAGAVSFDASAYLGGFTGDNAKVVFTFQGSAANAISSVALGPVLDTDIPSAQGMMWRRQIGQVPASTRRINVTITFNRVDGSYNDGSADNLVLILNTGGNEAALYGPNLLANGGAEAGPNSAENPSDVRDIPSWVRSSWVNVEDYAASITAGDLDPNLLPPNRGKSYFTGGRDAEISTANQDLIVSPASSSVDAGKVTYSLSGYLGGYASQDDNATITAQFMNWSGTILAQGVIGPVKAAERNNVSGFVQKTQTGPVPQGTRMIRILQTMTRTEGSYNDGYTDNIVFTLAGPAATTPKIAGIISLGDFGALASISSGSLVEIYGSNLSTTTRKWSGSDFNGVHAPTLLDGVSATVAGKPAFVNFVSPGQVNIQAPDGTGTGPVQVSVTNAAGTTNGFTVTAQNTAAGMLAPAAFKINGKQYVAAFVGPDYRSTFALPVGALSGVLSRPAKPGDTIVIYGVGFGPVSPTIPAGTLPSGSNTLTNTLQVLFGTTPATVSYDGLSGDIGVYQINVVVPPVGNNDAVPLTFNLGGVPASQTLYIAVHE